MQPHSRRALGHLGERGVCAPDELGQLPMASPRMGPPVRRRPHIVYGPDTRDDPGTIRRVAQATNACPVVAAEAYMEPTNSEMEPMHS